MWAEKIAAYSLPSCFGDPVAIALDLGGGGGDGPIQPLQLVFDGVTRQEPTRDAESLGVHDEHFADRHAGRNGNPLKTFHVDSTESADRSKRHRRAALRRLRSFRLDAGNRNRAARARRRLALAIAGLRKSASILKRAAAESSRHAMPFRRASVVLKMYC